MNKGKESSITTLYSLDLILCRLLTSANLRVLL